MSDTQRTTETRTEWLLKWADGSGDVVKARTAVARAVDMSEHPLASLWCREVTVTYGPWVEVSE